MKPLSPEEYLQEKYPYLNIGSIVCHVFPINEVCQRMQEFSSLQNAKLLKRIAELEKGKAELYESLERFINYADGLKARYDEENGRHTQFESSMVLQGKAALKNNFERCGDGFNVCNCKTAAECGYLPPNPTESK